MKRLFILASAAALMLASCAKTTVVYNEAPEEIGFKAVTGVMTKGTLETTADLGVFANKTLGDEYFANVQFENDEDENVWVGNPTQYWPLQGTLDFAYYSPFVENSNITRNYTYSVDPLALTDNDMVITYDDVKGKDVLFGKEVLANQSKPATDQAIDINLEHAVAQIIITAKANEADLIELNKVVLTNVITSGTLTVEYTTTVTNNMYSVSTAKWTDKGSQANYEFTDTGYLATDAEEYGSPIYIVPSDKNASDVEQTSLIVHYTIGSDQDGTKKTGTATIELGESWEMGKKYTYALDISVYEIKLNPTVEDMAEGTVSMVPEEL